MFVTQNFEQSFCLPKHPPPLPSSAKRALMARFEKRHTPNFAWRLPHSGFLNFFSKRTREQKNKFHETFLPTLFLF